MPQISIIIPIYNAERYLDECLGSIRKQTFQDFEAIMVDDGSKDNSAKICQHYVALDSRFKYIYKENGGASSARNRGLENANGEWISFIDADDWIQEEFLEVLRSAFNEETVDMAVCSYHTEYTILPKSKKSAILMEREEMLNNLFLENTLGYQGFVWNKMFRSKVIRNGNIVFDEKACFNEDRLFCVQYVITMDGKCQYISSILYNYCKRDGSVINTSDRIFNKGVYSDFDTSVKILQLLKEGGFPSRTINLARDRILDSYDYIRHKMRSSHYSNAIEEQNKLRSRAIGISGGILFFIDNRIRRFLSKQINHFVKNKVYLEKL